MDTNVDLTGENVCADVYHCDITNQKEEGIDLYRSIPFLCFLFNLLP